MINEIVATIGAKQKDINGIEALIEMGITHLRFNFSKFEQEVKERTELIKIIKQKHDVSIMLDIPFPGKKPRIYHKEPFKEFEKGEEMVLYSGREKGNGFWTDANQIGNTIKVKEKIMYSDGVASLTVKKRINDDSLLLEADSNFTFRSGKSLFMGMYLRQTEIPPYIISAVKATGAEEIALSFVEEKADVNLLKDQLVKSGINVDIYCKIETDRGIKNIDDICRDYDVIIGRGDMVLYSDYSELFFNQDRIIKAAQKNGKKVYVATGILSSLLYSEIPSQSDIVDLTNIAISNPTGIILNSPLLTTKPKRAMEVVERVDRIAERID